VPVSPKSRGMGLYKRWALIRGVTVVLIPIGCRPQLSLNVDIVLKPSLARHSSPLLAGHSSH